MGDYDEEARFLAACDECSAVYAATETNDGGILPIGSRTGCQCGSTSFSRVNRGGNGESIEEV